MTVSSVTSFVVFLALVFLVAMSGSVFRPGPWYEKLRKPSWTPPNKAFPIVWSILYLLIALAGWRVYEEAGLVVLPFAIYLLQLALNAAWSALFFGIRRADFAFADVVAMSVVIAINIAVFWPIDTLAALLLVPYLLWALTAACLNFSVWKLNGSEFARA